MRISDWSSDVCSSDLADIIARTAARRRLILTRGQRQRDGRGAGDQGKFLDHRMILSGGVTKPSRHPRGRLAEPPMGVLCDAFVTDRKRVVEGKRVSGRVDLGGCRFIKKKNTTRLTHH